MLLCLFASLAVCGSEPQSYSKSNATSKINYVSNIPQNFILAKKQQAVKNLKLLDYSQVMHPALIGFTYLASTPFAKRIGFSANAIKNMAFCHTALRRLYGHPLYKSYIVYKRYSLTQELCKSNEALVQQQFNIVATDNSVE